MIRDNRALASGFIGLVLILVVSAILYVMMSEPMYAIFSVAQDQATNQEAKDAIAQRKDIWFGVLWYVVLLGGVFIISRAVFESRRGA